MVPVSKLLTRSSNTREIEEVLNENYSGQYITLTSFCVINFISTDTGVMLDQILDPDHILRYINTGHKDSVNESLYNNCYDVLSVLLSAWFLPHEAYEVTII